MSRVVHIVGFSVTVGTRTRQLCAWCGEKLYDLDLANVAVFPAPKSGEQIGAKFEIGKLLAREGNAWWVLDHADGERLPADACAMVELDREEQIASGSAAREAQA